MNEQDYQQRNEENGSANRAVQMDQDICFLINHQDRGALYRLTDEKDEKIVSEPVEAFRLGVENQRLFYRTKDGSFWTCLADGREKRLVLGGNGDQVRYFAVNSQAVFLIVSNRNRQTLLYQLSQDLQDFQVIQKTEPGQAMEWVVADDRRLYYVLSGDTEKKTLVEYDLKTRKETVMAAEPGLCQLQLYHGFLVMQRSLTPWPRQDQDWEVLLMDPDTGDTKQLALGEVREINCYWDHAFYVTWRTAQVWAVPLAGGAPFRLWDQEAGQLDLTNGCLFFLDQQDHSYQTLPLEQEEGDWAFAPRQTESGRPDYFAEPPKEEPEPEPEWEDEVASEPDLEQEESEEEIRRRRWKELQQEEEEEQQAPPRRRWWGRKGKKEESTLSKEAVQAIFKSEMDDLWKESLGRTLLYNGCKLAMILLWCWLCLPMLVADFSGWTAVKAVGILLAEWLVLITLENRLYTPEMELLEEKYETQGAGMAYTPPGLRGPAFLAVVLAAVALTLLLRFGPAQIKDWLADRAPGQQQSQDVTGDQQPEDQP